MPVVRQRANGYEARAVGEAIFTEGETIEKIKINVRDAVCCHFEEEDRPRIVRLHYVRNEVVAIQRLPRPVCASVSQ